MVPGKIKLYVLLWFVLEVAVFVGIGWAIGFGYALIILLAPIVLGVILIKSSSGAKLSLNQQDMMMQLMSNPNGLKSIGLMLVSILFIIPGILLSIIGLVLWIPKVRAMALSYVMAKGMQALSRNMFQGPKAASNDADVDHSWPEGVLDDVIEGESEEIKSDDKPK